MSNSPFSIAGFGFFVSFVGLLAAGAYAYSLQGELARAHDATAAAVAERDALTARNTAAMSASQQALSSCEQREAELKAQVEEKKAAEAAPRKPRR
jgi:hypothetical protein